MNTSFADRAYLTLKLSVLALLVGFTVILWKPKGASALDGCTDGCIQNFGYCRACSGDWTGTVGYFSHCVGTSCYYVCGFTECETGG